MKISGCGLVFCIKEVIPMNELKEAIHDFRTEQSKFNFIKVLEQLRNSWVWIPCNLIMSDRDRDAWDKRVKAAAEQGQVTVLNVPQWNCLQSVQSVLHQSKVLTPQISGFLEELDIALEGLL